MGQPVAAGKPGMSLGDAAGWEMPSRRAGTSGTPGRASEAFSLLKQQSNILEASHGRSAFLPWLCPTWHSHEKLQTTWHPAGTAQRERRALPGLEKAQISLWSVCPCLHAHGQPSLGQHLALSSSGSTCQTPWARVGCFPCRQQCAGNTHPWKSSLAGSWDGNIPEKWLLTKAASLSPKPAWRAREGALPSPPIISLCVGLCRRSVCGSPQ